MVLSGQIDVSERFSFSNLLPEVDALRNRLNGRRDSHSSSIDFSARQIVHNDHIVPGLGQVQTSGPAAKSVSPNTTIGLFSSSSLLFLIRRSSLHERSSLPRGAGPPSNFLEGFPVLSEQ